MFVDFNILNQLGSPAINSNTFANRPAAGQTGRLFVSIDTFEIYRDNGTTWDLIGGPGSSTITGTGTATQVAYFTSSQAIGSSANLFWDNTAGALGINTNAPTAELDVHGAGVMLQLNATTATANSLLAFQRSGVGVWRIGDVYNSGSNYFEIFNTAISTNAIAVLAATNKTEFTAVQTYTSGLARANYFDYNLSVAAGGSFSSPNAITALGASLDLTLAGSATIPSGARSGLDAYNSIGFTGAGTLTHNQGAQIRAYSNVTAGWAFNGSATGTVTHLAGLRALFPDNTGSAINVTNNYALLLNDQTPNTGTVTYTNRWGVYQEGASDLNYFAANMLLGSTTNNGNKLQVTGTADITGSLGIGTTNPTANGLMIEKTGNHLFLRASSAAAGKYWNFDVTSTNQLYIINNAGTQYLTITDSGNVGIATTSPAQKFQINGPLALSNLGEDFTTNQEFAYPIIYAGNLSGLGNGELIIQPRTTATRSIRFVTRSSGAVSATNPDTKMIIRWDGNVGINTTSPTSKLQINSTSAGAATVAAFLNNESNTLSTEVRLAFAANSNNDIATNRYSYISALNTSGSNGQALLFATNVTGNSAVERARITDGGNFLIGTTTDAGQKLQVNGSIAATFISLLNTSGQIGSINSTNANGGYLTWETSGTTISDIGTAQQVYGSGGNDTLAINARGARSFLLGSNQTARLSVKPNGQIRFIPLAADPGGAEAGDVYYNSGTNKLRLYDGTNWVDLN